MAVAEKIDLGADVNLQQFFPAAVASIANQRVVDLDKRPSGVEKNNPS